MSKKSHSFSDFLKHNHFILLVILAAIITLIFVFWPKAAVSKANDLKAFAACLKDKGVVMYGVDTCAGCQNQKKVFGSAFDNLTYVNCDFQKGVCEQAGFQTYPTWAYKQQVLLGFQSFSSLALMSGCPLPTDTAQL